PSAASPWKWPWTSAQRSRSSNGSGRKPKRSPTSLTGRSARRWTSKTNSGDSRTAEEINRLVEKWPTPAPQHRLSSSSMAAPLVQILSSAADEPRKPAWLKVKAPGGPTYVALKHMMRDLKLHTVCEEAHCPNIGECWEHKAATFMILGDVCTRNCAYCAVAHGTPASLDAGEPKRLADAV